MYIFGIFLDKKNSQSNSPCLLLQLENLFLSQFLLIFFHISHWMPLSTDPCLCWALCKFANIDGVNLGTLSYSISNVPSKIHFDKGSEVLSAFLKRTSIINLDKSSGEIPSGIFRGGNVTGSLESLLLSIV